MRDLAACNVGVAGRGPAAARRRPLVRVEAVLAGAARRRRVGVVAIRQPAVPAGVGPVGPVAVVGAGAARRTWRRGRRVAAADAHAHRVADHEAARRERERGVVGGRRGRAVRGGGVVAAQHHRADVLVQVLGGGASVGGRPRVRVDEAVGAARADLGLRHDVRQCLRQQLRQLAQRAVHPRVDLEVWQWPRVGEFFGPGGWRVSWEVCACLGDLRQFME